MAKICITYNINNCLSCPKVHEERTYGAGYAHDYICMENNKTIVHYVEYPRDFPDIPSWCPNLVNN